MRKILYFGGQKSGKSLIAEKKAIELSSHKPYYIATYDNSYEDSEMQQRIDTHKFQRESNFITIEEPRDLSKVIKPNGTYLVDCISMWILNNIKAEINELLDQLEILAKIDANIIFVLNDVNGGIIPFEKETRTFVDHTGIIGQKLSSFCDEVYEVKFGLTVQLK
jgi:adenosylcobinamide kinase/adenosylcobinamide-phosphate guanylyltransferase